jgi:hypothetical protein
VSIAKAGLRDPLQACQGKVSILLTGQKKKVTIFKSIKKALVE